MGLGVVLGLGLGSELALGQGESCVKYISTRIYWNQSFAQTGKPDKDKRSVSSSKFFPNLQKISFFFFFQAFEFFPISNPLISLLPCGEYSTTYTPVFFSTFFFSNLFKSFFVRIALSKISLGKPNSW